MKVKDRSAAEAIYQLCSYDNLGHSTNYNSQLSLNSEFNQDSYDRNKAINNFNEIACSIHDRCSVRSFNNRINNTIINTILFNSYAKKNKNGSFTIPLAGGLDIMKLFILRPENKSWRLFSYDSTHYCQLDSKATLPSLCKIFFSRSIDFDSVSCCFLIGADLFSLSKQYYARAYKFACIQSGHIAQNILLISTSMGIRTLPLGSLIEEEIASISPIFENYLPLYAVLV